MLSFSKARGREKKCIIGGKENGRIIVRESKKGFDHWFIEKQEK